jgi:hypothetical protein
MTRAGMSIGVAGVIDDGAPGTRAAGVRDMCRILAKIVVSQKRETKFVSLFIWSGGGFL